MFLNTYRVRPVLRDALSYPLQVDYIGMLLFRAGSPQQQDRTSTSHLAAHAGLRERQELDS